MSEPRAPRLGLPAFAWSAGAALAALLPLARFLPLWLGALGLALMLIAALLARRGRRLPDLVRLLLTLALVVGVLVDYGLPFGARFGRDTGTALLASMMVMKLFELDHLRDARLLTSIALFALMAGFLQDRGPLTLALAVAAALVALAALTRFADDESPVAGARTPGTGDRLRTAGRIALYSLPLALVAFFLFPRLAQPLWGLPGNSKEARTGLSDTMSPGDIASLYVDDSPALRVRFDGPQPAKATLYWRGPVLDEYDGSRWRRSERAARMAPPPLADAGATVAYEIEQEPTERPFLLALDLPLAAPPGMALDGDRSVIAGRPLIEVSRHRLQSATRYRFEPRLSPAQRQRLTDLPGRRHPRARALGAQWRSEAGDDERAIIARALDMFHREFRYTLEPGYMRRDSVDQFLFMTRAGYCEHFASAFAVLMRAAGIPTRVVTGYQGGIDNDVGDYLLVRQSDAHAWNEVWLADAGWVRIDPTSAVAPERVDHSISARDDSAAGWGALTRPLFDTADWLRRGWNDFVLGYNAMRQRELLQPLGVDAGDWRQLGLLLGAGIGLAVAVTVLLLLRRPPDSEDPLLRAWRRFVARLARAGVVKRPDEGPATFARRAATALPASAGQILDLSDDYVRQRYAEVDPEAAARSELVHRLHRFRVTRRTPA